MRHAHQPADFAFRILPKLPIGMMKTGHSLNDVCNKKCDIRGLPLVSVDPRPAQRTLNRAKATFGATFYSPGFSSIARLKTATPLLLLGDFSSNRSLRIYIAQFI
jgi:hypothetical protein